MHVFNSFSKAIVNIIHRAEKKPANIPLFSLFPIYKEKVIIRHKHALAKKKRKENPVKLIQIVFHSAKGIKLSLGYRTALL